MTDRRTTILDAAIELLGTEGMRALTHRAVDEAAALPSGSTSNLFRTRDALLVGVVSRIVERERSGFGASVPLTPEELAVALAKGAKLSVGKERAVTLARYAILVEGGMRPSIQDELARGGARVNDWSIELLRVVGSKNPERDQAIVANYVTGLVLHELARPTKGFDPTERLIHLVQTLLEAS